MNIGILGGTFDPPHIGHFWAAMQLKEEYKLDQFWLMPTYKSFWKLNATNDDKRYRMLALFNQDMKGSGIEVNYLEVENKFEYTFETIDFLKKNFPENSFKIFVGNDWDVKEFKNYEEIKQHLIVYDRKNQFKMNFEVSSSEIRKRIKNGLSVQGLVSEDVKRFILANKLYKSVKYNKVLEYIQNRNKDLLVKDFIYDIEIVHNDGSKFSLKNSAYESYYNWILIFSEHHQPMIYHPSDLSEMVVHKYNEFKLRMVDNSEETSNLHKYSLK